jgi:hypothetical protein
MKKLAFGALFIGLLAACGGGDDVQIIEIDAGDGPDASQACNPVAQTGCGADEKCTWINITDDLGTIGCVPNGTAGTGEACAYGPNGETSGFDDCLAQNICIGGACQGICTLADNGGCDNTTSCSRYSGLWANGSDTPIYGACDFLCDPVDQTRDFDNAAACGSIDPAAPNRGCYMPPDDFGSCAPIPAESATQTQGEEAYGPAPGTPYLNGCAAGYAPLLLDAIGGTIVICNAYCDPIETHSGAQGGFQGQAPYSCADRATTEECRYFWFLEGDETTPPTHTDGVGFCWEPDNYITDWDGDATTPETGAPRCQDLPNTDVDGTGGPDHADWACAPFQAAFHGQVKRHKPPFRAASRFAE